MFNTYQELVDRIEELLAERKKDKRKIDKLEDMYSRIPKYMIQTMFANGIITEHERNFWEILQYKRKGSDDNE